MVVWYSETLDPGQIEDLGDLQVEWASNQRQLLELIVGENRPSCILLHCDMRTDHFQSLVESLSRLFPSLHLGLVLPSEALTQFRGNKHRVFTLDAQGFGAIKAALATTDNGERRRYLRFDWPLNAVVRLGNAAPRRFRVRSVGAGGVFLEEPDALPESDSEGSIEITFNDFRLIAGCRVVGVREQTGNRPRGFAVQFTDISPSSIRVIDAIVRDEFMRSVLEP
jgi:hypothetical protein